MSKRIIYFIIGFLLFCLIMVSGISIVSLTKKEQPEIEEQRIHTHIIQKEEEESEQEEEELQKNEIETEKEEKSEEKKEEESKEPDLENEQQIAETEIEENEQIQEPEEILKPPVYNEDSELVAYNKLSKEEQGLYDSLFDCVQNRRAYMELEQPVDKKMVETCVACINMDHPEIYWYSNNYTYWTDAVSGLVTKFEPHYIMSEEEITQYDAQIWAQADDIIYGISPNASDYEKVQYVYESIVLSTDYIMGVPYNQSMASVLLNHEAVCAGYAKTMQYILHELDIPCIYIPGEGTNELGTEKHAWNIVEIDGEYYGVDSTWGDPIGMDDPLYISYDYLCRDDDFMNQEHKSESPVPMPACTDDSMNYYQMNDMWYESYDSEQIQPKVQSEMEKGTPMTFAFSNKEAYKEMMSDLESNAFSEIIRNAKGVDTVGYSYSYNEKTCVISVIWTK